VRVTLLPSSTVGDNTSLQYLTSVLLNDTVALDAGCLGLYGGVDEQARVKHVFLSHSHIDHLASLPVFLNTVFQGDPDCVTVYGGEAVLDCLRRDVFNDRLWPDFIRISAEGVPYLKVRTLYPGRPVEVDGLRLTPVEVNHVVPTMGFLVEDAGSAVIFSSDTGPTEAIWELANRAPNLKAVFLEVTFPDAQAWLADVSKHLTPAQFGREARKVQRPVPFIAVHHHPRGRDQVIKELEALGLLQVEVGRFGVPYQF
jgi:ribonuclease BN (tRNA processing enzyme)